MHLGTFQISQNIQQHAAPSQFAARNERPKNPWLSAKLFAAQTSARDAKREKVTPSRRQHRYAARPVRITASWHSAHLFAAPTLCTRRQPAIYETPTCRKQHSIHPKCPQNHTSTNFKK